nr:P0 protein [Cowpea polerovirus 1]
MFVTVPLSSGCLELFLDTEDLYQRLAAFNLALLIHTCQNVYTSQDQLCSFIFLLPLIVLGVDLHDAYWSLNGPCFRRFANLLGVIIEYDQAGRPRIYRSPDPARENRGVRRDRLYRARATILGTALPRFPEVLCRGRSYFETFLAVALREIERDDSYIVRNRPRAADPRMVIRDLRDALRSLEFCDSMDDARAAATLLGILNENFHPSIAVCFRRLVCLPMRCIISSSYKTAVDLFENSVLQATLRN